jgi:hypothetical protein
MPNRKAGRWIMELTDMERQRSALVSVTAALRRRGMLHAKQTTQSSVLIVRSVRSRQRLTNND